MWRRGGHGGAVAAAPLQRQRGPEETPLPVEFPAAEDRGAEEPPFDDSDLPDQLQGTNGSQRFRNITTSFANQLLLVSLLEHLCHMYTEDPARSRRLFQLLCKTFIGMRLLSDFAVLEEFSSLRLQHKRAITELMKAAKKQIINEEFGKGDCNTNREKEIIFEAQTSRYINEFDELSRLGEGGYGTVFKVRNKLDGQFYAIKKILIKKATKRDCMKVLREVKVLAGLQHPNIVGYHTAWMEHVQPTGPKDATALSLPSLKMPSGQSGSEIQDTEDSGSIVFADLTSGDSVGKTQEQNKMNSCTLSTESHESSSINDTESNSTHGEHKPSLVSYHSWDRCNNNTSNSYCGEEYPQKDMALQQQCEVEYHLMLHIQMQLCEISLWDWIVDRNKTCKNSEDASSIYQHIDNHWTLKIFQELLEGVYYIHSMGVMHRDIKPRNIFLQGSDHHVKIGDFGLACKDIIQEDTAHLLNAKKLNGFSHTSGVGTCLYASPEQLQGSHYDFKSDMYSLGIILLELFQPFGTEMERTKVLMGVRNGNIPPAFSRKWPVQTKYVKLLTNSVSSQRPTAIQLLESELFNNAANVICSLQQKVMQQEEEIKLLKEKVQLLLQEKDERDRIKQLGSPV